MIKFLLKIAVYITLILIFLEVMVRVFHLHNDVPTRFVDIDNINKWIPNQKGYAVYGNRVQNIAEYNINSAGFNSYREFNPSIRKIEVALIGDSFIEGFHQDYYNSIGKKIEKKIKGIEVYEYGHSSNDFADQLYLTYKNKAQFSKINILIYYLRFSEDLERAEYKHIVRKPLFQKFRRSKLLEYSINIGLMDPIKDAIVFAKRLSSGKLHSDLNKTISKKILNKDSGLKKQLNFDELIAKYEFDKNKSAILLDSRVTPEYFISHLHDLEIEVIDFAKSFEEAGGYRKTTLIYDQHWNDLGRSLISLEILKFLEKSNLRKK